MSNLTKARALYNSNLSSKENQALFIRELGLKQGTAAVYASKFKKEFEAAGPFPIADEKPVKKAVEKTVAPIRGGLKDYKPQSDLDDFFNEMSQEEKESWPEELAALTDYYTQNPVFGGRKKIIARAE